VVFVVSAEQDTAEYSKRLVRYGSQLKVDFVAQKLTSGISAEKIETVVGTRKKPWGTGHALLVCREIIDNPFVVINADDYYGRSNFKKIGGYLLENTSDPIACALPGYKLENTLSSTGGVNRGVCTVSSDGYLTSIHEVKNICLGESNLLQSDPIENNINIDSDSIVSMTFWGFHPSFFNALDSAFRSFLNNATDIINDEFYIPLAVDFATGSGKLKPRLFPTSEKWKGVTYAEDLQEVRDYMAELTDAGYYPDFDKRELES